MEHKSDSIGRKDLSSERVYIAIGPDFDSLISSPPMTHKEMSQNRLLPDEGIAFMEDVQCANSLLSLSNDPVGYTSEGINADDCIVSSFPFVPSEKIDQVVTRNATNRHRRLTFSGDEMIWKKKAPKNQNANLKPKRRRLIDRSLTKCRKLSPCDGRADKSKKSAIANNVQQRDIAHVRRRGRSTLTSQRASLGEPRDFEAQMTETVRRPVTTKTVDLSMIVSVPSVSADVKLTMFDASTAVHPIYEQPTEDVLRRMQEQEFEVVHINANDEGPLPDTDLYTPRFQSGSGKDKIALCPICASKGVEGWYRLQSSRYWYHLHYFHGISSITKKPMPPPSELRIPEKNMATLRASFDKIKHLSKNNEMVEPLEGKCGLCNKWVNLRSPALVRVQVEQLYWWKHVQKCVAKH